MIYITTITWTNDSPSADDLPKIRRAAYRMANDTDNFVSQTEQESTYSIERSWLTEETAQNWVDWVSTNYAPISAAISVREQD